MGLQGTQKLGVSREDGNANQAVKAVEYLKKAGKGDLDVATNMGLTTTTEAVGSLEK